MICNIVIDVLRVISDYGEPLVTGFFGRRGIYVKHRRVSIGNIIGSGSKQLKIDICLKHRVSLQYPKSECIKGNNKLFVLKDFDL